MPSVYSVVPRRTTAPVKHGKADPLRPPATDGTGTTRLSAHAAAVRSLWGRTRQFPTLRVSVIFNCSDETVWVNKAHEK